MEFCCMHKEAGIYKNCLLERAVIPLYVPATKPDLVYNLIHMLLTFRTAIACTVRKIMHNSDDNVNHFRIIKYVDFVTRLNSINDHLSAKITV